MPPWEKYAASQPQASGPWAKYAAPKAETAQQRADKAATTRLKSNPDWLRSITQGATFGFADELDAAGAAGTTAVNNALRKVTGKPDVGYGAKEAYDAVLRANRQGDKAFAKERPVTNFALQVAGGAWVPGAGYIGKSASLGQAALRSAQVGGALGAVAGAGNAEGGLGKRVMGAAKGGAVGAAIGGATPYVARGAQKVGNAVAGAASETADRIRLGLGGELPEISPQQAERASGNALSYVQGLARRSPNALASNPIEAAGKPILAAEALGRPGITELGAIARRSGATGDALESTLRQRSEGLGGRILDDLSRATGMTPEEVAMSIADRAKAGRAAAAPLYNAAYSEPAVDAPQLEALLNRPSLREAMGRASTIAAEEGRDPMELGLRTAFGPGVPKTTYQNKTVLERGPLGEPVEATRRIPIVEENVPDSYFSKKPTVQTLDYIKRGVDDILEGYRNPTTGKLQLDERGRAILGTLNEYRDIIAPDGSKYRAALDAGGEPIRLEQAFNNAKKLMSNNVPLRVFDARFQALSPADRQAHVAGFVDGTLQDVQAGRLRLKDMQSPLFREKITRMLGEENASAFLTQVANEAQLARTGGRMMPGTNSPTFEYAAANQEQEEALGSLIGAGRSLIQGRPVQAALQVVTAPVIGAYRGARVPLDRATRDEVGRLLQLSPSELDQILSEIAARRPTYTPPATGQVSNALARSAGGATGQPSQ